MWSVIRRKAGEVCDLRVYLPSISQNKKMDRWSRTLALQSTVCWHAMSCRFMSLSYYVMRLSYCYGVSLSYHVMRLSYYVIVTVCHCHIMSCHCHIIWCHVMSCHVMSCHVMSCHIDARLGRKDSTWALGPVVWPWSSNSWKSWWRWPCWSWRWPCWSWRWLW